MSSGPETRFIASVQKHLPPVGQFYRMKNHNQYNGGIADSWYSSALDLWVEWKWVDLPKRPETVISIVDGKKPSLSALQQDWIQGRVREGRNVWVVVGCELGGVVFMGGWGDGRWTTKDFTAMVKPRQDIAALIWNFCR